MSLLFMDGFDHYASGDVRQKWPTSNSNFAVATSGSRFNSGQYATYSNSGSQWSIARNIASMDTWIVGLSLYINNLGNQHTFIRLLDAGSDQVNLRVNTSGTLSVVRGGTNGTVLATSTGTLAVGTWYFIEFKVKIHNTAGTAEVRVSGTNSGWINASGLNTRNTANSQADSLRLGSENGNGPRIDDVYVCDINGSINNDFLGDCRIETLYPDGDGNSTQFTPSSGLNYQCVDDSTPNGDTDYVSSSTADNIDTYTLGNLSGTPASILGVQTHLSARKDDGGSRTFQSVLRISGTNYFGSSTFSAADSYLFYSQIFEQNPAISAAWLGSAINGMEAGVKLVS